MKKYAINVIGYGKNRRYVPVMIANGFIVPIARSFKTEEDAMNEIKKNGFTCSAIGDVYTII